jgi:hypothetical protein
MADIDAQTRLNARFNDALTDFLNETGTDIETVLNAIDDAKSDAIDVYQTWAAQ